MLLSTSARITGPPLPTNPGLLPTHLLSSTATPGLQGLPDRWARPRQPLGILPLAGGPCDRQQARRMPLSSRPALLALQAPTSLQWYLEIFPQLPPEQQPLELVQQAGDTIFVPAGARACGWHACACMHGCQGAWLLHACRACPRDSCAPGAP